MAHPGRDPTGRDADFDWCLAFGEGARTMPADPPDPAKPELAGVELELPRTAFEWPAHGFTSAPEGHELYTPKKVAHWGPGRRSGGFRASGRRCRGASAAALPRREAPP